MNPHSRPTSTHDPASPRRSGRLHAAELGGTLEDLPTLAHILARYREHGTLARSIAAFDPSGSPCLPGAATVAAPPAPASLKAAQSQASPPARALNPRPFAEVIEGLQTRELDGKDLFEQFFGSAASPEPLRPPAPR